MASKKNNVSKNIKKRPASQSAHKSKAAPAKKPQVKELKWVDLDDTDEYEEYEGGYATGDDPYRKKKVYEYEDDEYLDDDYEEYDESDYDDYDDYDEDDYEDDYDDYDDDYEEDYDDTPSFRDRIAGIGAAIGDWFESRTTMDMLLMGGGALVVAAIITIGVYFFGNEFGSTKLSSQFAKVGNELSEVNIIGEQGILAVSEARSAQNAELSEEELDEDMLDEEEVAVSETDSDGRITVVMNLTSIQRDLKIKFVNNNTKGLISGYPFEVSITDPSGTKSTKTNTSKDGIIYLTGITPGKYQVALVGPNDEKLNYLKDPVTIAVKDTIEYKKVDITGEVKKESEINVAQEDTAVNDTVVESSNQDTVEWVESTKTLIEGTATGQDTYEEIPKDKIADPGKASISLKKLNVRFEPEDENGNSEGNENTESDPTPATEPTTEPTQAPTEEPKPTDAPTPTPTEAPTPSPSPSASATASPSASSSASPSVTPTGSPSASPTPSAAADTTTALKSTSGDVLYIKDGDTYKEAKYADYYKENIKFYKKIPSTEGGKYKYTGWQNIDGYTYFYDKNGNYVTGEQVIQGARYTFDSEGRLSSGSGVLGIDVSKWNGNINWTEVKNSGVNFVIIRCGYRGSTVGALVEDSKFRANIKGARDAGLKVGVYFFTQAVNEVEAVEEASMVLNLVSGYNLSFPIFLDVESSGGRGDKINAATRTAVCKAFCQTIANSGYKAGIYANKSWFTSNINTSQLTGYKIWLAQYAAKPTYSATRYDMWQYSSKGSVAGISGNVDMNISYMGY